MSEVAGDEMEKALDIRTGVRIATPAVIGPTANNAV